MGTTKATEDSIYRKTSIISLMLFSIIAGFSLWQLGWLHSLTDINLTSRLPDFENDATSRFKNGPLPDAVLQSSFRDAQEHFAALRNRDFENISRLSINKREVKNFDEALKRGEELLKMIEASPDCQEQSKWTSYLELQTYGWFLQRRAAMDPTKDDESMPKLYKDLDFSNDEEDNENIMWWHKDDSDPIGEDNKIYKATLAMYNNIYNSKLIIAGRNFGPDYMARVVSKPPIPPDEVVPLKQWSDITFLQWEDYCGGDEDSMRALRGIVRKSIYNDVTQTIAEDCLARTGDHLSFWGDGEAKYTMASEEGQALLGSPNGNGVAWFLGSHKMKLGRLRVTDVTVFKTANYKEDNWISLLFRIEVHPEGIKWPKEEGEEEGEEEDGEEEGDGDDGEGDDSGVEIEDGEGGDTGLAIDDSVMTAA